MDLILLSSAKILKPSGEAGFLLSVDLSLKQTLYFLLLHLLGYQPWFKRAGSFFVAS